jgi:hypothetical protein
MAHLPFRRELSNNDAAVTGWLPAEFDWPMPVFCAWPPDIAAAMTAFIPYSI